MEKGSGIYQILNLKNKKFYIGSTNNFYIRWYNHKSALNTNKHHSVILQRAWNKYGKDNLEFRIIEKTSNDRKTLLEREQYYIDLLKPKYNISKIAGRPTDKPLTKEQLIKKSKVFRENLHEKRKNLKDILITEYELEKINKIEDIEISRLVFTLLVYYKNNNCKKTKAKWKWIAYDADVRIAKPNFIKLLNKHNIKNYIKFNDKYFEILFVEDNDKTNNVFKINTLEKVGLLYEKYLGGNIGECSECGNCIRMTCNNKKYCDDCRRKNNTKKKRVWWNKTKAKNIGVINE